MNGRGNIFLNVPIATIGNRYLRAKIRIQIASFVANVYGKECYHEGSEPTHDGGRVPATARRVRAGEEAPQGHAQADGVQWQNVRVKTGSGHGEESGSDVKGKNNMCVA